LEVEIFAGTYFCVDLFLQDFKRVSKTKTIFGRINFWEIAKITTRVNFFL